MDDLSRALNESLLDNLECPGCGEYMVPPIKMCANGHNICGTCRGNVEFCPTCGSEFSDVRNVALESIARELNYPCTNRGRGCVEFFSVEQISEHQDFCTYGRIRCPFNRVGVQCSWRGVTGELKTHAESEHRESYRVFPGNSHTMTLDSPIEGSDSKLLFCLRQTFLYKRAVRDGKLYSAVQLVGTRTDASKYKFKVTAANGIEQISVTLFVPSYLEDMETSLSSGHCLSLDEVMIRKFAVEGMIKWIIKLSPVY